MQGLDMAQLDDTIHSFFHSKDRLVKMTPTEAEFKLLNLIEDIGSDYSDKESDVILTKAFNLLIKRLNVKFEVNVRIG